ncbi:O-methyltransferase [Apiospora saccharicola]|uniref:O-methyltransferase n=1 Tax=Apiospora saccharicola TaxID=335842 RepID=A0ABR1UGP0_9PEZI
MAPTLRASLAQVHPDQFDDCDNERLALIEEAKQLISRLQTKEERIYDLTFTQPIVFAALQTCLDVGLWAGWSEAGGKATSVEDLCKLCHDDIEPNLLRI